MMCIIKKCTKPQRHVFLLKPQNIKSQCRLGRFPGRRVACVSSIFNGLVAFVHEKKEVLNTTNIQKSSSLQSEEILMGTSREPLVYNPDIQTPPKNIFTPKT